MDLNLTHEEWMMLTCLGVLVLLIGGAWLADKLPW